MAIATATVLARIRFGSGAIALGPDGIWQASDNRLEATARIATALSQPPFYEYSPAHGSYGCLLAHQIAERLSGEVELPGGDTKEEAGELVEEIVF